MNRKTAVIASGLLAGLAITVTIAFFALKGDEFTVYVEPEKIQEAIDAKLPFSKRVALIFDLHIRDTKITLPEGTDRIQASTNIDLGGKLQGETKNVGGAVVSEAGIRYDQENFCFYILDPEVRSVTIQGVPEQYTQRVTDAAKPILQKYLSEVRVYRIRDDNVKMKLAKAVLKRVRVAHGKLELTLGY
ncbi:MAG TPA: DUF1439 domain-containing protein [Phycisphaerae bacterium]|nr:DUF1439 domain-containing protein [Phycisphaerae bacterium]HRW54087.1 DUF1439 domain-containing protein [Phycisphaerae bacterium]